MQYVKKKNRASACKKNNNKNTWKWVSFIRPHLNKKPRNIFFFCQRLLNTETPFNYTINKNFKNQIETKKNWLITNKWINKWWIIGHIFPKCTGWRLKSGHMHGPFGLPFEFGCKICFGIKFRSAVFCHKTMTDMFSRKWFIVPASASLPATCHFSCDVIVILRGY